MGVWLLPTIVSIIGFIIFLIVVFVMIRINIITSRIDVLPNMPLIDVTTRKEFTNGYAFGVVKNESARKNGTILFELYPLDSEQGENKIRPQIQPVVIAKQYIRRLPKGEGSSRREIIKILPRDPTDIPKSLRGTLEGDWMTKESQLAFLEKNFTMGMKNTAESLHEAMRNWSATGMTRATLAQMKEEASELKKLYSSPEPERKKDEVVKK